MATTAQVAAALSSQGLPKPSDQWLSTLLTSQRTLPPLLALVATAKHRLLCSDFTNGAILESSTPSFPANLSDPVVRELKLQGSIPVQILGIEDLSKSRWEQIEAIEAHERGEGTKGREVIRVVAAEEGENGLPANLPPSAATSGPHRVIMQDWKGQQIYGMELKPVGKLKLGMDIGTKMMLKGSTVARGMVLLEPGTVMVLGGKIEAMHKGWLGNRKKELREAIDAIEARQ